MYNNAKYKYPFDSYLLFPFSVVLYQDQSKRKETRMILFFVCTKCDHAFSDPSLDNQPETEET